MPFLKADEAPTQAERETMPAHLFGLPDEKKYPLDTPEHVRAAASYGAKEHNAGKLSGEQFAELNRNLKKAREKFKIGEENQEDSTVGAPPRDDSKWERVQRVDLASGELGERKRTQQGGLVARANMTRTGVLKYRQPDGSVRRELRHPDEVFDKDSLATLAHATLTADHPSKVTPSNWKAVTIGHVAGTPHKAGKFVQGDIHIQHGDAIDSAERGHLQELSCGYECAIDPTPGEYEGQPYDAVQRRIRYNHVAAGPAGWGRAGPEVRMHLDGGACVSGGDEPSARYVRDKMAETEAEKKIREDAERKARADADQMATILADNAKLKGDLAKLQGAVDVFEREKQTQDSAKKSADSQARADAEFDAHLAMLEEARHWLGPKWDRKREDGSRKSLSDIRREIVGHLEPGMKLDGSDDYIAGACAAAIRRAEQGQQGCARCSSRVTTIW